MSIENPRQEAAGEEREFTVLMVRAMSQGKTVTATSLKEAATKALDENDLSANAGNDFDDAGDVWVSEILDETGKCIWNHEVDDEELIAE